MKRIKFYQTTQNIKIFRHVFNFNLPLLEKTASLGNSHFLICVFNSVKVRGFIFCKEVQEDRAYTLHLLFFS